MDEEERPRRAAAGVARDLKTLSVGELETYRAELLAEVTRVEAEIAKRGDVRSAADAFFRRPGAKASG